MNIRSRVISASLGVFLLSGCAKYKSKPLGTPQGVVQEQHGISLQAAQLSKQECKRIFGNRSPHTKGYQTIQLSIMNKTPHDYELKASQITTEIASAQHVAKQVGFNGAGRIAGWGIAGLFLTPLLFVPALVEGANSSKANKALKQDFDTRTISNDSNICISPNSLLNRVMFVTTENYKTTFDISLINRETGGIEKFTVHLK